MRVSLGMAPLPVPGAAPDSSDSDSESEKEPESTVESRQAQSYDNYKKVQEAEAAKKKRDERAAAVRKARENAQRLAKLEGSGLGDAKDGDADAKSWLMGQKKRQKKIDKARKLEEELAAAEAEAAAAVQYTSKDLAGIKVAHDNSNFLDGEDQVLTLKDTNIGAEDDDDELENINLREQEKLEDRLDLKKKRPGYNPNDDDDSAGGILAQYDEEIHGKKGKKFTLDAIGSFGEIADILDKPVEKTQKTQNVSLDDIVDNTVSSDYLAPAEIKVKKPKKSKKNKGTRKKQADDDDIFPVDAAPSGDAMEVDTAQEAPSKKRKVDDDFEDDEDLQASLAMQRRNALKKRKKTRPEDIAKQLKEQGDEPVKQESTNDDAGLVIDGISEFVSGLGKQDEEEEQRLRKRRKPSTASPEPNTAPVPTQDHEMPDAEAAIVKEEEEANHEPQEAGEQYEDEEKTVGGGMGAALSLLRERGLVEETKDSRYEKLKANQEFLAKKRILEEELDEETRRQRERDRKSGRLDKMSTREREEYSRQQNQWRDQQQSRRMDELYNAFYVPSFSIKYHDEHGRELDRGEAWKELSHKFHGKGSGKGKTEKKLKKIEDEKLAESRSMFDPTQNSAMSNATAQQLKKRKEAGVRLG